MAKETSTFEVPRRAKKDGDDELVGPRKYDYDKEDVRKRIKMITVRFLLFS